MDLAAARTLALALPGTVEQPHLDYGSWRANGRIYATIPPAGTHLHVLVDDDVRAEARMLEPEAVADLPWGRSIVGVRVDLARVSDALLEHLLRTAWARQVQKKPARERRVARTVAQVEAGAPLYAGKQT